MDKSELRKKVLALRKELAPEEAERLSRLAQRRLLAEPVWQRAGSVALYAAAKRETQTRLLMEEAWKSGKIVYLPRVVRVTQEQSGPSNGLMHFAPCVGPEQLVPGAFGIFEPEAACPACVFCPSGSAGLPDQASAPLPDIFVIPGLAFDRQGHRLGWGGGYYDRYLAGLRAPDEAERGGPKIVALAYSFQLLDSIPHDVWDKPVDAVCTDKELLWTS